MSEAGERLAACMAELGISVNSTFVPWSRSRNAKEGGKLKDRSLNWKVAITRGNQSLVTDYSAGIGHCPSYKQGPVTLDMEKAIIEETESGKTAKLYGNLGIYRGGKPIEPDVCDVMSSLVLDSSAIDAATFEDWVHQFGYDVDSRKAEASYRACLETGLKLRSMVGDDGLRKLKEACDGY